MRSGGSSYGDEHNSAHGEKGLSEYDRRNAFEKGLKGEHANEYQKGAYGTSKDQTIGHHDTANHYAHQNHAAKAHRGASFSNKKGHDEGSKTTGYHKVLNKDEFKKEHSFYDKADRRGFFNRHGDFDTQHSAKEDSFKEGGNHKSGVRENEYGARGQTDKGKFIGENEGYKGARGYDKYNKNYEDYAANRGQNRDSVNGYTEGDKYASIWIEGRQSTETENFANDVF